MTISVLMSTYCKEKPKYLDEAMKSIWTDQIRKPDEIILVEDGPLTDDLYKVISKWKAQLKDVMKVVSKPINQGLAMALNDGLNVASGNLIARMDTDDRSLPNRFLVQEQYMVQHEEVDILGGAIEEFNDEGTFRNTCTYPKTMEDVLKTMYRVSPVAHPAVMYRKSFFDAGFRYSDKYHICEDVTMWYDAAAAHRVINNLPDIILEFRRNASVMKRRRKEKAWSEFLAYNDGIRRVYGLFTYKYVFSFLRMCFRLMPSSIVSFIYNGNLRKIVARRPYK